MISETIFRTGIKDGSRIFSKRKQRSKSGFSNPRSLESQESGAETVSPFSFFFSGMICVALCR